VVNELRSHTVHTCFLEAFKPTHTIKQVSLSKMDDVYQHPNIQIFQLKKRRGIKVSDIDTAEKSDDDEQPAGNDPS
jgi:hypothetical protein